MSFSKELQEFFIGIGVDWVLWILVGLSVLSVAVILERLVFYQRRRVHPDALRSLARGDLGAAPARCIEHRVAARLADLQAQGASRADAEEAADTELRKARLRYESGLTFLATLGNNAPFVGLLGTVLGVMAAFAHLAEIADPNQKNELLMISISEALIATAMGLVVAIPAVLFYNVFRKRVNGAVEQAREVSTHRIRDLFGSTDAAGGGTDGRIRAGA